MQQAQAVPVAGAPPMQQAQGVAMAMPGQPMMVQPGQPMMAQAQPMMAPAQPMMVQPQVLVQQPMQQMSAPPLNHFLDASTFVTVKQEVEILEVITGFETENEYQIIGIDASTRPSSPRTAARGSSAARSASSRCGYSAPTATGRRSTCCRSSARSAAASRRAASA